MLSKLSSTATANDGLAVVTAQLLTSTGIENLNAEVGDLGLVTAINQGVFKADATSTTDDASALGINQASSIPPSPLALPIPRSQLRTSTLPKSVQQALVVMPGANSSPHPLVWLT